MRKVSRNSSEMLQILIGLILTFAFVPVNGAVKERQYELVFTKAQCFHNSSVFRSFECNLRNNTDNRFVVDGRAELATTLNGFRVRSILTGIGRNIPRFKLYDVNLDACPLLETMSKITKNKLLVVFIRTINQHMNAEVRCPVRKDFNYTMTGFDYKAEDYPNYIPESQFDAVSYIIVQNKIAATILFSGRVIRVYNAKSKQKSN